MLLFLMFCLCARLLSGQPALDAAYEQARAHDYRPALLAFDAILASDPGHIEAQIGRAYTLAWQGDYAAAEAAFRKLSEGPQATEAQKGLAYVALWQGDGPEALRRFAALVAAHPEESEYTEGLALAHMHAGQLRAAREGAAHLSDPVKARALRQAIQAAPAAWEAWLWGGLTHYPGLSRSGLRAGQVSWQPRPSQSLWVRFDNALSQDNVALMIQDTGAVAFFAGGRWSPGPRWTFVAEAGQRFLPTGRQALLRYEQTWFVRPGFGWRSGVLAGLGAGQAPELLLTTGAALRLGDRLWLEPNLYTAWAQQQFDQWRGVLALKYHLPAGHEWTLGGQWGRQYLPEQGGAAAPIRGVWLQYQLPLGQRHWLFLLARHEDLPGARFQTLALGLRLRLEE